MDSIDHPRLSYAISMIAVNVAVKSALQFMNQLLTGYMDIKLEEVEISDDEKFWNITLSAIPPPPEEGPSQSPLATMFKPKDLRTYKRFAVNATTGDVKSMTIRVVA